MKIGIQIFSALVLSILLGACVTTKKNKQDTGFIGKKYHDLTAKFNGYFNANELYKASIIQLEEGHEDNYGHLLDIYKYDAIEDRSAVSDDMDLAIEKVTKVAALHEPSKWVDDCYVLMGKAQYLKGDYESAQETFEYFVDDFNPKDPDSRVYQSPDRKETTKERRQAAERERKIQEEQRKKENEAKEKTRKQKEKERKKEQRQREKERKQRQKDRKKGKRTETPVPKAEVVDTISAPVIAEPTAVAGLDNEVPIDPDEEYLNQIESESRAQRAKEVEKNTKGGGFLKHKPAYYEGMLWLAKTYVAREKWLDANYYLDRLENEGGLPDNVTKELPIVRADLLIKQKNYGAAVPALENAIEHSGDRKFKARLAFITAQLHQINGNSAEAYTAFDRVNDFRPDYEMSLNAKLNQLRNSYASSGSSRESSLRTLEKMAKEDKNIDYLGTIYFTMAEIELAEGNETEALAFFNEALSHSSGSGNMVDIYYRLASLFLGRERYYDAKIYYDSTLTVMQKSDERYPIASKYANNLTNIAKNIDIIQTNDSLLVLGNMSEEELNSFARKRAEETLKEREEDKPVEPTGGFTATTTVLSGNSKFFAYNQAALQRGQRDFRNRWGNRPLEDDWRRSNKSSSLLEVVDETEEIAEVLEEDINREIERVLRDVPRSDEEKTKILGYLEKANYELGTGYRSYIENYLKSNETLLQLLTRFPETKYRVEAYFYLYLNYLDLGDSQQADNYFNRIISEFPESDFAKFLNDPTGENVLMTDERKIEVYYQSAYEIFEKTMYQETFDRLEKAKELFGTEHKMAAKYELLRAMCIGNLKGKDDYINALRGVMLNHKNTPEHTYATEMMRFLRGDSESLGGVIPEEALENFVLDDDKLHYIVVIVYDASGPDINEIKKQINSYNSKHHESGRLRSTSIYLNQENKTHLVLIRRFSDKEESMDYFNGAEDRKNEFINPDDYSFELLAINQKNYREVIKQKSIRNYRAFFEANYF